MLCLFFFSELELEFMLYLPWSTAQTDSIPRQPPLVIDGRRNSVVLFRCMLYLKYTCKIKFRDREGQRETERERNRQTDRQTGRHRSNYLDKSDWLFLHIFVRNMSMYIKLEIKHHEKSFWMPSYELASFVHIFFMNFNNGNSTIYSLLSEHENYPV